MKTSDVKRFPMSDALISKLKTIVGDAFVLTNVEDMGSYMEEQRKKFDSAPLAVVRPKSTQEVSDVVKVCAEASMAIVPQGGNTGLVGGAIAEGTIIVALGRMNQIRNVNADDYTMTVDAGCILQDVRTAAANVGCIFPLSLGAQGSCQIGGNLATNVGGINTLHYGTARDVVLGLEVVLPDGRVWDGLRSLSKDNTGYSLRNLFVGSEGTLGIITGAVLKLRPAAVDTQTAFCAFHNLENVLPLLNQARRISGDAVTAFELIPRRGVEFSSQYIEGLSDPLETAYPWYALIEFSTSSPDVPLRTMFETFLEQVFEEGIIDDAMIAESLEQANMLWRLREELPQAQKFEGGSIKHDVSVPVRQVPTMIERGMTAILELIPGSRPVPFGHVGDGNIHFNVSRPLDMDDDTFLALWPDANRVVHDIVDELGGSFSAEHGVGRLKVDELVRYRSAEELDLLRRIKDAIDPQGIMNPNVLLKSSH